MEGGGGGAIPLIHPLEPRLAALFFIRAIGSSHTEVSLVKGVLKICSKFTAEHSCRSVISIKLQCKNCTFSPYSVRMRENEDQNNSEYWHFSRSGIFDLFCMFWYNVTCLTIISAKISYLLSASIICHFLANKEKKWKSVIWGRGARKLTFCEWYPFWMAP